MACRQLMLLGAASLRVAAVPWAEPMATIGLLGPFDERGWTPKPTPPPMPRGGIEDWGVDGAYYNMPRDFGEMYKRQLPNTCGYDQGIFTSSVTCQSGDGCVTNTVDFAIGCCTALDCTLPTACNNLADGCDSECQTDSYVAYCGASTAPYCFTRYFIQDILTTFTAFDCAPVAYTQTNSFSTVSFSLSGSSSSSFSFGSDSSSSSSFAFISAPPSVVTVYKTAPANPSPSVVPGNGGGGAVGDNSSGNSNGNSNSGGGGGGSSTPVGAIAGGVVGGVVVIALIIGLIFFFRRRSNKKKQESQVPPQGPSPTSPQPLMQQYPPPPQSPQPGFYPYAPPQQGSPGPYSQAPYSPTLQQQNSYPGSPAPPQHSPQPPQQPFYGGGGGYPQGYQTGDDNNNLAIGGGGAAGMASPGMSPASPQPSYMTSGVGTMNTLPPQEAVGTTGTQGQGLHENVHEVPAETVNRDVGEKAAAETGALQTRTVELGA